MGLLFYSDDNNLCLLLDLICFRDVLFTSSVNCVTSFFAGFVVFAVLGYMSTRTGKDIKDVATEGKVH